MNQFWIKVLSVPLLAAALVSCPTDMGTGIKITAIDASATPATISSAATSSLTATVSGTGAFNAAVNWSIVSGGGSLSASSGSSVTYTAPIVNSSTAVQIKASAAGDSSVSKTLSITVQPATSTPKPIINAFSATPLSLTAAGQVTLSWDVSDATSLSIDSGVGAVTGTSKVVSVTSSTAFTLTATNANGSSTSTVTVTVASLPAPPTVVSVSPANGETGVKADAKIVVTFSKPMDEVSTQAAYQSSDLPTGSVTFEWNASSTVLTVLPNAPLVYATGTSFDFSFDPKVYALKFTGIAKDKTGQMLSQFNLQFKTLRLITTTRLSDTTRSGSVASNGVADTEVDIFAGDDFPNYGIRGFLSFDLLVIPVAVPLASLSRATLKVFKVSVTGNPTPYETLNPDPCNGTNQCDQYVPINLDHVLYGNTLSGAAYSIPPIASLGPIDTYQIPVNTYAEANVLSAVRDDLTNRSSRANVSQYRLSFPLGTNNDGVRQVTTFNSGRSAAQYPVLVLEHLLP